MTRVNNRGLQRPGWIDLDLDGLAQLLSRRSKEFIVFELVQNTWDEQTSKAEVLLPRPEGGKSRIVVRDDSAAGFRDLTHAFTLYAQSDKKRNPQQRGMFNAGEKFVLAFCEEASIVSTTGTVVFDRKGRRRSRKRTRSGSEFSGVVKMTIDEWKQICAAVQTLIPPIPTYFNGVEIPPRTALREFECALPTIEADADGALHCKTRKTQVRVYEPRPGEVATLYEMGIPVVPTADKWHVDIQQKVPLNLERDNVPPSYLQSIRVAVLNAMSDRLSGEDASDSWVRQAAGDKRINGQVFNSLIHQRFGDRRVTFDPSDREANLIAVSKGFVVIAPGALSADEWDNVRRFGSSLPAGQVTPSPKPFSLTGKPLRMLSSADQTTAHLSFESFVKSLATELMGHSVIVEFADDVKWGFRGCYGKGRLIVNVAAVGTTWFEGACGTRLEQWVPFILHEFAHDRVSGHLTDAYHEECCRLAGKLARAMHENSALFSI